MKKEKKLKIIGNLLDTLYYILTIILLFFHPYVDTIIYYSNTFFIIIFLFPIIFLFLPTILKKIMHLNEFLSIIYSFIVIITFFLMTVFGGYLTHKYFKDFSSEKWKNNNYCNMRNRMIDSLENKYALIGMDRKEIYDILGKPEDRICSYDYEQNNKVCYMTFEAMMKNDFYCIYFDENDIVFNVEKKTVR